MCETYPTESVATRKGSVDFKDGASQVQLSPPQHISLRQISCSHSLTYTKHPSILSEQGLF